MNPGVGIVSRLALGLIHVLKAILFLYGNNFTNQRGAKIYARS